MSDLLCSHKNQFEKVLAQQEAKEKQETTLGEVMSALMQGAWATAKALLDPLRPEEVEQMVDYGGMTVLHHAVRSLDLDFVLSICTKCPTLVNKATLPHRQPGHWTALMILANMKTPPAMSVEEEAESEIGYLLCQHMTLDALNCRGSTWATATHMAVSRGKWALIKSILYRIDDLGGRNAVLAHTRLTNNNVPWLF